MAKPIKKSSKHIERNKILFILSVIVVLTIIVFSNSINNGFITNWDDQKYVVDNPNIRSLSLQNISNMFTSNYFANYHPLTLLTYSVEYNLFGLNPTPYHTTNLIFHLFNVILVFFFIRLLTNRTDAATIVALFFAIHPMHVESVSWISERKDVLYSFFYLGGLISYLYYLKNTRNLKYLYLTFGLFILSLLSKSAAVTFSVMLILIDYYFKREFKRRLIIEKVPFFALSILFGIIAIISQKEGGALDMTAVSFSFLDRIFIACYALLFYIFKLFVPVNLSIYHFYPVKTGSMLPIEYYVAPVIILLIIWAIYKSPKLRKEIIFGTLFFLISISLVIQIIPFGDTFAAERYSYIPYLGIFFIIGQFYCYVIDRKIFVARNIKRYLLVVLVGYAIIFSFTTYNRNKVWKDGLVLFTDVIDKYASASFAYYNRGLEEYRTKDYANAIKDFSETIRLNSRYVMEAYYNRGVAKGIIQDYQGAINDFNKTIELKPDFAAAYSNRGNTKGILQDFSGAINDYNKAIELKPDLGEAYHYRGIAKASMKDFYNACNDWQKAVQLGYNKSDELIQSYCNQIR